MFLSRNNKNNVYPCKPQFYYIKVGFKGVKIIYVCKKSKVLKHPDLTVFTLFTIFFKLFAGPSSLVDKRVDS